MRSLKPSGADMRRRSLIIVLASAGIFGGSTDHSHSVAVVAAAEQAPADQQHKNLIERYLQAISEQDGSGAAVVDASEETESCFAGWDASCQDNASFLSVMGASCGMHERFDCTMLHAIGYTEKEVYDVVNNCPCACEMPCGQWTFTPSSSPSSSPSSAPSASPSASPTSQPSDAPSSSPTNSPSSSPSAAPSAAPTASPSSAPSSGPTISMAPSASPTAFPSAAPSSSPSFSPSSAPTEQPTPRPTFTPKPSSPPTSAPTVAPTLSLPPTKSESIGVGEEESKSNSGMVGGILAAFAGVSGVVALAYCAKRGRFNKPWGEPVHSFGSREDALTTEEYNNGYQFSKAGKSGFNDMERGNAGIEECPSAIDQLYSISEESAGSFHIPMMVEDRIEIVEVPALGNTSSLGSDGVGGSFDVQLSKSISKSFAEGDLEMITEVSIGDGNSVDEDFSSGHPESDLEKMTEVSVGETSSVDDEFYTGYGADDDSVSRCQRYEEPKKYRRRRAAQRTPPRPDGGRTPGGDSIVRSASRSGRPPLFASPSMERSESIGRMTMLSTPQSVDSECSVELILPHEGSI